MRKLSFFILISFIFIGFMSAQTITVTSPHAGNTWYKGSTHNITWTSTGIPASTNMKINIFKDSITQENFKLQLLSTNTGSKSWTIPTSFETGTYYIRIKTTDNATHGDSEAFTITVRPHPIVKAISIKSVSLSMVEEESGTILKSPAGDSTTYFGAYMPSAGDTNSEHGCYRGFMSFDISQLQSLLPSGSTITKARLFIDKRRIARNPFYKLGNFQVINIEYSNLLRNKQENYNKEGPFLYNKRGHNREIDIAGIDVTTRFKSLLDDRHTRFQVRLQFSVENNGDRKSDRIHFAKGAEGCVLKVYYHE